MSYTLTSGRIPAQYRQMGYMARGVAYVFALSPSISQAISS